MVYQIIKRKSSDKEMVNWRLSIYFKAFQMVNNLRKNLNKKTLTMTCLMYIFK